MLLDRTSVMPRDISPDRRECGMNEGDWMLALFAVAAVACGLWFAVDLVILTFGGLLDLFR